jgi:ribosomal protein RSM22 (predicted rRNA methylase)
MLDHNPALRALAGELIDPPVNILAGDLGVTKKPADLVIASYVLAEFPERTAAAAANDLWRSAGRMLLLVEPGTPQGFARIRGARAALIEAGAHIAAPCTHDKECPMQGADWCHFSQRLARSRAHMIAKGATVPFEDERYSYVVAVREPVVHAKGRIIKPVLEAKPGLTLPLCEAGGLKNHFIARRDKEAYRAARKLEWGDLF